LAVVISWWISAITVSEMLLNPIVYYYLRAPDPEVVLARAKGWSKAAINRLTDYNLSAFGKRYTLAFWLILAVIGAMMMTGRNVGHTSFVFFANLPPTETAKYVDPSYTTAHVTFFCRNHKGDNVARIIARCQEFIRDNPMEKANFRLAGGLIGVLAAANEALVRNDLLMNFLGFFT